MSVHFPESLSLASILAEPCVCHQERLWIRLAKDHLETNPITIKPDIASHAAEQFSWVPLPYCSPPGGPFPIKSLALSAHVSPRTIHFWMLDKSPVSGPGRGPPSCNTTSGFFPQASSIVLEILFQVTQNQILKWNWNICPVYQDEEIWIQTWFEFASFLSPVLPETGMGIIWYIL